MGYLAKVIIFADNANKSSNDSLRYLWKKIILNRLQNLFTSLGYGI